MSVLAVATTATCTEIDESSLFLHFPTQGSKQKSCFMKLRHKKILFHGVIVHGMFPCSGSQKC